MAHLLSRQLLSPKRQKLYNLISQKVEAASKTYPERDYGSALNAEIANMRRNVSDALAEEGYIGKYPYFRKGDIRIIAAEEHPFTIMEQEDFLFRIQLMVSENKQTKSEKEKYKKPQDKPHIEGGRAVHVGEPAGARNAGFFRGRGRSGWIMSLEDFRTRFHAE